MLISVLPACELPVVTVRSKWPVWVFTHTIVSPCGVARNALLGMVIAWGLSSTRNLMARVLALGVECCNLGSFLLLERSCDHTTTIIAIVVYSVFTATNAWRHTPPMAAEVVDDMLRQSCYKAVASHEPSRRRLEYALSGRFCS